MSGTNTAALDALTAALKALVKHRAETIQNRAAQSPGVTAVASFDGGTAALIGHLGDDFGRRWVVLGVIPAGSARLEVWPHARAKAGNHPILTINRPKRPAPRLLCEDVTAVSTAELMRILARPLGGQCLDVRIAPSAEATA